MEKKNKKNRRRASLKWFFGYIVTVLLLDILFWPLGLNWLGGFIHNISGVKLFSTFAEIYPERAHWYRLILNWDFAFNPLGLKGGYSLMIISLAWHLGLIAITMALYGTVHTGSLVAGDEHGSARWMEDDEFDDQLPADRFRPNEYAYEQQSDHREFEILQSQNVNIFDAFEFKSTEFETFKNSLRKEAHND